MAITNAPSVINNWAQSKLYKVISSRKKTQDDEIATLLKSVLPNIQKLLSEAHTSPPDFTLHDAGHAARVAQRMTWIIPADVLPKLTTYELGLLLLSAYLHDIGMTPSQKITQSLYHYLLTGDSGTLSDSETQALRYWLDDLHEDIPIPIATGTPQPGVLMRAHALMTHYCRARHVTWSTQWIETNLRGRGMPGYPHWVDDLLPAARPMNPFWCRAL
jgi:hypothetical protein